MVIDESDVTASAYVTAISVKIGKYTPEKWQGITMRYTVDQNG